MSLLPAEPVVTGYITSFASVSTHTQGYLKQRSIFLSIKIHINWQCIVTVFPKF